MMHVYITSLASHVHYIIVHKLPGEVVRSALDATFQTLVAGCLARLHKAFYLVLLALGTCWKRQTCNAIGT